MILQRAFVSTGMSYTFLRSRKLFARQSGFLVRGCT